MPESKEQAPGLPIDVEGSPSCFGDPNRVCPRDEDGIIQPQVSCVSCELLRNCLQEALRKEGLISGPAGQSHLVSKTTHFLKRWSNKKLAHTESEDHPAPP